VGDAAEFDFTPTAVWRVAHLDVGGVDDAVHVGEIIFTGDGGGVDHALCDSVEDGVEVGGGRIALRADGVTQTTGQSAQRLIAGAETVGLRTSPALAGDDARIRAPRCGNRIIFVHAEDAVPDVVSVLSGAEMGG